MRVRVAGVGRVRAVAVGVVAAMVVTLGASTVAASESEPGGPASEQAAVAQEWASAAATPVEPEGVAEETMPDFVPGRVAWPGPGAADVVVPARGRSGVGRTVVSVGAPAGPGAVRPLALPGTAGQVPGAQAPSVQAQQPPASVRVEVLDRTAAEQVGGVGVAVMVTPLDGAPESSVRGVSRPGQRGREMLQVQRPRRARVLMLRWSRPAPRPHRTVLLRPGGRRRRSGRSRGTWGR